MKIDLNDPRITAFALGELKGDDAIEIARAVRTNARVRAAVDEARETSRMLMETLGGNDTFMLTPDQRAAVRDAGPSPAIAEISSAKVPVWKNPAMAGIGVAAAVALTLYIVGGRPGSGSGNGGNDGPEKWDWAQVNMESLTVPAEHGLPVVNGISGDDSSESDIHAVSSAISDDTTSFRKEVEQRIEGMKDEEIASAVSLPELEDSSNQRWQTVLAGQRLNVPLAAGATSWPWIKRSIQDQGKLPPHRAVRIEEMVNHFRYKKPTMISGGGLIADMELCHTPWNPMSVLLAVHVSAEPGASTAGASALLSFNPEKVKRVRIIGYARMKNTVAETAVTGPSQVSRSHGNYVIYELETISSAEVSDNGAIATLALGKQSGKQARLPIGHITSWIHASSDMRFASAVSACGMILHQASASAPDGSSASTLGELDASRLVSLLDIIEKQDVAALGGDRRDALKLLRQAAGVVAVNKGN